MAHMMTTRRMAAMSDENALVGGAVGVKKTGIGLRARGGPLGNRTNIMQGGEEGNNNLMMLVKPPSKPTVGKKGGGDVNIAEPTAMQVCHFFFTCKMFLITRNNCCCLLMVLDVYYIYCCH